MAMIGDMAGERIASALVSLGVDIRPLQRGLAQAAGETEAAGNSLGNKFGFIGKAMTGLVIGGIAIIAAATIEGIRAADRLDATLAKLGTTMGYTDAQIASVRQHLLDMSTRVPQSANDLATAFNGVAAAGYKEADALAITEAASKAAVVAHSDLASTSSVLTTVMKGWGFAAKDVNAITAEVTKTVINGRLDWSTYARIMGTVTPIAKSVGLSFEDVNAAIIGVGRSGLPARRAVSGVMALVTQLATYPPSMQKALAALNVHYDVHMLKTKGLMGVLAMFDKAAGGHHDIIVRMANGQIDVAKSTKATEAANQGYMNSLRAMVGSGGLIAADALIANHFSLMKQGQAVVKDTSKSLDDMYQTQKNADLGTQFSILKNDIQDAAIGMGTMLLPLVKQFMGWLIQIVPQLLTGLGQVGQVIGSIVGGIVGLFDQAQSVAAPFLASLGGAAGGATGLLGNILSVHPTAQLIGAAVDATQHVQSDSGKKSHQDLGPSKQSAFDSAKSWIGYFITGIEQRIPVMIQNLQKMGGALWDWIKKSVPLLATALGNVLTTIWDWVAENGPILLSKMLNWVTDFVGWVASAIPPLLQQLGVWAQSLLGWIWNVALPKVLKMLGNMAAAFLPWIGDVIQKLPGALAGIVVALHDWFIGSGSNPGVLQSLLNWFGSIPGGIWDWLTNTLVPTMMSWVTSFEKIGQTWGNSVLNAIVNAIKGIPGAIADFIRSIKIDIGPFHISGASGISVDLPWSNNSSAATPAGVNNTSTRFGGYGHAAGAWNIPHDEQAMIHAGEMILPAPIASLLRSKSSGLHGLGSLSGRLRGLDTQPRKSGMQPVGLGGGGGRSIHIGSVTVLSDPDERSLLATFDFMQPAGA